MRTVKSRAARLVALALLWMVLPGAAEATENLAHLAASGHLAHAAASGDSHSDPGPEHGCTGMFHICSCHLAPASLLAAQDPISSAAGGEGSLLVERPAHPPSAHLHNIEHPPRS